MDSYNSSVTVYGFFVSIISSGMIISGFDILCNENKLLKDIGFRALGGSLFIGGIYLFVPSVFRNLWFK